MKNLSEDEMTLVLGGSWNWQALKGDNCQNCFEYVAWTIIFELCKKALSGVIVSGSTVVSGGAAVPAGLVLAAAVESWLCDQCQNDAIEHAKQYCPACASEFWE